MKPDTLAVLDQTKTGALAVSAAAIVLGLFIPPLPLFRRRAMSTGLIACVLWLVVIFVFFFAAFGPALFGHIALWAAASLAMLLPGPLKRLESRLALLIRGFTKP